MKKLIGGVLLAVGLLVAGASGLCSIAVLVSGLADQSGADDFISFLPAIGVFGGIPFAGGVGLFLLGRALVRDDTPGATPPAEDPKDEQPNP